MYFFMESLRLTLLKLDHVFNVSRVEDALFLHMKNGDKYRITVERIS